MEFLLSHKGKVQTKGYTLLPNNSYDNSIPSIIRCYFGQSNQEFEQVQMIIRYAFTSDFPSMYEDEMRAAFDEWEAASNNKFKWIEDNSNPYMMIKFDLSGGNVLAVAAFPHYTNQGIHVGDQIRVSNTWFHPTTGTYVALYGIEETQVRLKNTLMHEVGHNLGFSSFQ